MIVVIEGLRGSGKSTLIDRLMDELYQFEHIKFVKFQKRTWAPDDCTETSRVQVAIPQLVELFTMLYEPEKLYICDRSWTITNVVYNRLAKLETPEIVLNPPWLGDLHVFYCRTGGDYPYVEGVYDEQIGFGIRFSELACPLIYLPWEPLKNRVARAMFHLSGWFGPDLRRGMQ